MCKLSGGVESFNPSESIASVDDRMEEVQVAERDRVECQNWSTYIRYSIRGRTIPAVIRKGYG